MSSIDQGGGKRCTTSNKGPDQNSKAVGSVLVPNGFALDPDAVIREGTGAVELAVGGAHPCIPPHAPKREQGSSPVRDHQSVKGQFCGRTELPVRLSWQCQCPVGPPGIGALSGKHSADTEPLRL
jgi:hypothetical protein